MKTTLKQPSVNKGFIIDQSSNLKLYMATISFSPIEKWS